jgi:hypothetical protein
MAIVDAAKFIFHFTFIDFKFPGSEILVEDKNILEEKIRNYKKRASILRTKMLARELPETPISVNRETGSDGSNSVQTDGSTGSAMISQFEGLKTASKVLDSAVSAYEKAKCIDEDYAVSATLSTIGSKIGSTTVAAIDKAKTLEDEYHVSEKVVQTVKSSVSTVQKIEEDYQVTQTVSSASRDVANLVTDYEERYQIKQKVNTLVAETWEAMKSLSVQAAEYDRRYQLSQRAGTAIMEGMSSAAELAREAARAQWAYLYEKPAEAAPALPPNAQV